ncbi:DNA-binding MarR family transcriptional regulator [Caulobacter ginsengisoli]|uniref:DNA-binding MarR family transcriptional regulator n=1 Tax=Caulobacter ginsengisoli TaxID=400775 RepID=A0ABU0IPY8_9CAUL|nr:transcriptional regulator [Caulobacter ginsengisoli]MDQ0464029.1 DNA-binding MarR family transcriptional regulator [Caulobacter ginsengisoli]
MSLDSVIHPPARLQIAALLATVTDAEFALLRETTGVSDSVLSKHIKAMEEVGYLRIRKAPAGGKTRTWLALTPLGRSAFAAHVKALQALAAAAAAAAPEVAKAG